MMGLLDRLLQPSFELKALVESQEKSDELLASALSDLRACKAKAAVDLQASEKRLANFKEMSMRKAIDIHPAWRLLEECGETLTVKQIKDRGISSEGLTAFLKRGAEIGMLEKLSGPVRYRFMGR